MKKKSIITVVLILLVFFVISFLTNILGALNPSIKDSFNLEFSSLGFMSIAFFSAYGIMSIPSGLLVEKYKAKKVMILAFGLATIGAFSFVLFPTFVVFLCSLFLIGSGMAMLQVVINPLLREAGGEEHFAFNSVLGQLAFGLAGVVGPYLFAYLMTNIGSADDQNSFVNTLSELVPSDLTWVSIYWIFGLVALIMTIIILLFRFPKIELTDDEKTGAWAMYKTLFQNKTVVLFFIGMLCYVGFEQGVSFWMSQFLETYHGIDSNTLGAEAVGNYWGLLTLGCLLGLVLLKIMDSKKVLLIFSSLAAIALVIALYGSADIALLAFPAVGFFTSVMYSIIFSLALNSVNEHHGSFGGIMCAGIIGGAIAPFIVGWLSDIFGLRGGMLFNFLTLAYILAIGIWAKPLVKNKIGLK